MTDVSAAHPTGSNRNTLRIEAGVLTVEPRGLDRVWGFRTRVTVPLSEITAVRVRPDRRGIALGWRGPGLDTGIKRVGTFHPRGERTYWNVSGGGSLLEIVVAGGDPFHRLYLSVADPESGRAAIAAAMR